MAEAVVVTEVPIITPEPETGFFRSIWNGIKALGRAVKAGAIAAKDWIVRSGKSAGAWTKRTSGTVWTWMKSSAVTTWGWITTGSAKTWNGMKWFGAKTVVVAKATPQFLWMTAGWTLRVISNVVRFIMGMFLNMTVGLVVAFSFIAFALAWLYDKYETKVHDGTVKMSRSRRSGDQVAVVIQEAKDTVTAAEALRDEVVEAEANLAAAEELKAELLKKHITINDVKHLSDELHISPEARLAMFKDLLAKANLTGDEGMTKEAQNNLHGHISFLEEYYLPNGKHSELLLMDASKAFWAAKTRRTKGNLPAAMKKGFDAERHFIELEVTKALVENEPAHA